MSVNDRQAVHPDPRLVGQRFSRAASGYENHAWHQKRAAAELAQAIPADEAPASILEWGCGTGELTERLLRRWPRSRLTALDIAPGMLRCCRERLGGGEERLRFLEADAECWGNTGMSSGETFDLLASSCAVQWFGRRSTLSARSAGLVHPGGLIALAIPVAGTLAEFWSSLTAVVASSRTGLDLWEGARYFEQFETAEWHPLNRWTRRYVHWFPTALAAVRSISRIGASCGGHPGWSGVSPAELRKTIGVYAAEHAGPSGVPCTYEMAFILARRNRP